MFNGTAKSSVFARPLTRVLRDQQRLIAISEVPADWQRLIVGSGVRPIMRPSVAGGDLHGSQIRRPLVASLCPSICLHSCAAVLWAYASVAR